MLAFTAAQAAARAGGVTGFLARHQAWLFFPLLTLEGFSLHVDSIIAIKTGRYRSRRGVFASGDDVHYLHRQVLSSRNVRGGPFTDFAMGGLNYQIEHHLFPNMPRGALRQAQPIVRAFCAAHDVSYCETSLLGSYRAGLGHLNDVGASLRDAPKGSKY